MTDPPGPGVPSERPGPEREQMPRDPPARLTIAVLWAYLVISVLLLIVKPIQIATGG